MEWHPTDTKTVPEFYFNEIRRTDTETLFYLNGVLVHRQPR